jgi:hypothetical protein
VAGSCEYGDEPLRSGTTELVSGVYTKKGSVLPPWGRGGGGGGAKQHYSGGYLYNIFNLSFRKESRYGDLVCKFHVTLYIQSLLEQVRACVYVVIYLGRI